MLWPPPFDIEDDQDEEIRTQRSSAGSGGVGAADRHGRAGGRQTSAERKRTDTAGGTKTEGTGAGAEKAAGAGHLPGKEERHIGLLRHPARLV